MASKRFLLPTALLIPLAVALLTGCQFTAPGESLLEPQKPAAQEENPLTILNDADLPDTYAGGAYEVRLLTRGGVPGFHWRMEKGALPPGIQLSEHEGVLRGSAQRPGEFQFTLAVRDNGGHAVQKQFFLRVRSALALVWKNFARVNGNRIEGSVEVSNTTPDDVDLTFVVLAVASDNGRATAIGYQHFVLPKATTAKELPFGETLPYGGYVIHVDAVGEVAAKNMIYRDRLQTPHALQVTVGP